MTKFLQLLFKESLTIYIPKSNVLKKFNEAGVPVTWTRLVLSRIFFEKKAAYPPWAPSKKICLVLPMKDPEENIQIVE